MRVLHTLEMGPDGMADTKIEEGVMVMKDGKAWGVDWEGKGYVHAVLGEISSPEFVLRPEDLTYRGGPDTKHLSEGKLVRVRRTTKLEVFKNG